MQRFTNPNTGQFRDAPTGFSWTSFFSTFLICIPLPPAARGHWAAFVIQFAINILVAVAFFWPGLFVMGLVWGACYNHWHVSWLRSNGYQEEREPEPNPEVVPLPRHYANATDRDVMVTYEMDGVTSSIIVKPGGRFEYDALGCQIVSFTAVPTN